MRIMNSIRVYLIMLEPLHFPAATALLGTWQTWAKGNVKRASMCFMYKALVTNRNYIKDIFINKPIIYLYCTTTAFNNKSASCNACFLQ